MKTQHGQVHDAGSARNAATEVWAIVLAGGEGTRMARLTEAIHGRPVPKQYATLLGDRTFLQETISRIRPLTPPERTIVVVGREHEGLAREQLAEAGALHIIAQPAGRGTGPGLLLPLAQVLDHAPRAAVVVFPSDHHFERPDVFLAAVRQALHDAHAAPSGVSLIGARADHAATDFGWIVPEGGAGGGVSLVESFVEKPAQPIAESLFARGGLWNTLVVAAAAEALWRLGLQHLPQQTALLATWRKRRPGARRDSLLEEIYRDMKRGDLCRDVFERTRGLAVTAMEGAGWSDCGTPERLVGCLYGKPELESLRRRLELGGRSMSDRRGHPGMD